MRISDWSSDVCSSDLFRNEVVKFALRMRASNNGRNPSWTSYEKIRDVIERRMFSQVEDLLPVISFGSKKDGETEKKHDELVDRMIARGYTVLQVRRLVDWSMRVQQAGSWRRARSEEPTSELQTI